MKIAVTGSAGFIGSNFVSLLLKEDKDCEILCIDSMTYAGNPDNLKSVAKNPRFSFSKTDIRDKNGISKLFKSEKPEIVVNFAAETHVDRSIKNAAMFMTTNIIGTHVLLEESLKNNVRRFHQVSTDEVYGDLPLEKPDLKFSEESPLRPSSPYSASKASADLLVLSYFKTHGLDVTISRCSNNYGPYQFPEKLIPLIILNALDNKSLPVYGNGYNIRDWLFVSDHCEAVRLIINGGKAGEIYNIGGSSELRNIDVVRMILSELKKPETLIQYVSDRKGHDLRYAVDYSKISRELGWRPTVAFLQGVKKTIKWYCENTGWYKRIISGEYKKQGLSG